MLVSHTQMHKHSQICSLAVLAVLVWWGPSWGLIEGEALCETGGTARGWRRPAYRGEALLYLTFSLYTLPLLYTVTSISLFLLVMFLLFRFLLWNLSLWLLPVLSIFLVKLSWYQAFYYHPSLSLNTPFAPYLLLTTSPLVSYRLLGAVCIVCHPGPQSRSRASQ